MVATTVALRLQVAVRQVADDDTTEVLAALDERACIIERTPEVRWICAVERLPRILRGLGLKLADVRICRLSNPSETAGRELLRVASVMS